MENAQNVQNHSSQVQTPKPELRNVKPKPISSRNILIHTFVKYHWLFLIGFLGVSIGSAAISLYSLTHVELLKSEQTNQTTVEVTQAITVPPQRSNPVPLWMVAAIALSCASGCLILCRWLNRPVKTKKYRRQEVRNQKPVPKPRQPVPRTHSSTQNDYRTFVPSARKRVPQNGVYRNRNTQIPTKIPTQIPSMKRIPTVKKSMATILPPQSKSFLLKNQELKTKPSLADRMDLRQQNSLSTLLQEK